MLELKRLVNNPEDANRRLAKRDPHLHVDAIIAMDTTRRALLSRHNELRHEQREMSEGFKQKGTPPEDMKALRTKLQGISARVKTLDGEIKTVEESIREALLHYPNLPQDDVPDGRDESDNVEIRTWGVPRTLDFEPVEHDALGEQLGILDFEAASRLSGSGFAVYLGAGARLERSLASFMLDMHTEQHGYTEVLAPFIVRREAMVGTGQLPKFEDDAFRTEPDDMFLIPTAEVTVTNMYREQLLDATALPIRHAAFSACFRREAGSYGRDARGLTRVHQFQKVEMVQLVAPEDSLAAHEALTGHAEAILQALELPYRVMDLCGGDLGFGAARCFDIEVWLPVQQRWREISSCSNFLDFQARRADIRYRPEPGAKPQFVHTINGSGLAIGRTVMALLENYQQADGSVVVPEALRPYMRMDVIR
ncbi:MAG: seryl-tRNA synthetase [Myxococcota bacterium]|jgi:seryl-tRNA synthetase